ncbi:unnamed protein product [Gordionus sp. m RMFG-2023]|uniref:uncharacterized protein LOC135928313 n=1 Tax=Gordionus sp. m RMFG-2023 TaxID=3053472 RepID=UPI0030E06E36
MPFSNFLKIAHPLIRNLTSDSMNKSVEMTFYDPSVGAIQPNKNSSFKKQGSSNEFNSDFLGVLRKMLNLEQWVTESSTNKSKDLKLNKTINRQSRPTLKKNSNDFLIKQQNINHTSIKNKSKINLKRNRIQGAFNLTKRHRTFKNNILKIEKGIRKFVKQVNISKINYNNVKVKNVSMMSKFPNKSKDNFINQIRNLDWRMLWNLVNAYYLCRDPLPNVSCNMHNPCPTNYRCDIRLNFDDYGFCCSDYNGVKHISKNYLENMDFTTWQPLLSPNNNDHYLNIANRARKINSYSHAKLDFNQILKLNHQTYLPYTRTRLLNRNKHFLKNNIQDYRQNAYNTKKEFMRDPQNKFSNFLDVYFKLSQLNASNVAFKNNLLLMDNKNRNINTLTTGKVKNGTCPAILEYNELYKCNSIGNLCYDDLGCGINNHFKCCPSQCGLRCFKSI